MFSPRHPMPLNSLKRGFKVTPTMCGVVPDSARGVTPIRMRVNHMASSICRAGPYAAAHQSQRCATPEVGQCMLTL